MLSHKNILKQIGFDKKRYKINPKSEETGELAVIYGDYVPTKFNFTVYIGNTISLDSIPNVYPINGLFDDSVVVVSSIKPNIYMNKTVNLPSIPISVEENATFTGYVKYRSILNLIERKRLTIYRNNKNILSYRKINGYKRVDNISFIRTSIVSMWKKSKFEQLENMFYGLICDIRFYPYYLELILEQMKEDKIDTLHLRITLGTIFRYINDKKELIPIEQELKLIDKYLGDNVKLIAQVDKYLPLEKITKHLEELESIENSRIIAYDLSGKETFGYDYRKLKDILESTRRPWRISVGLGVNLILNMNLLNDIGNVSRSIGHGIATYCNTELFRKYHFELTPILYYVTGVMSYHEIQNLIVTFIRDNISFSINSGSPNKYYDNTIQDNLKFLRQLGFSKKDILSIVNNDNIKYDD